MENLSIADYASGTLFPVRNVCVDPLCTFDHGSSVLQLRWYRNEPTTIFAIAGEDSQTNQIQEFVTSREFLYEALHAGTDKGFPVIGEGNVMCQVLKDARALIAIGFNEVYVILANRNDLTEWLMGTYVHVRRDQEESVLEIDRLIGQLLYK